jgi:hypothetical protein
VLCHLLPTRRLRAEPLVTCFDLLSPDELTRSARNSSQVRRPTARSGARLAPARNAQQQDATQQADRLRQSALVDAFLAAARNGDFDALLALLDPDVVLRADEHAVKLGAARETRGAQHVAAFSQRAHGAKPALLNGAAAAVWMPGGRPRVVLDFTTSGHRIIAIDVIANPDRLRDLSLVIPEDPLKPHRRGAATQKQRSIAAPVEGPDGSSAPQAGGGPAPGAASRGRRLPCDSLACLTRRFVVLVGRPALPCLAGSRTGLMRQPREHRGYGARHNLWTFAVFTRGEFVESDTPAGGLVLACGGSFRRVGGAGRVGAGALVGPVAAALHQHQGNANDHCLTLGRGCPWRLLVGQPESRCPEGRGLGLHPVGCAVGCRPSSR